MVLKTDICMPKNEDGPYLIPYTKINSTDENLSVIPKTVKLLKETQEKA